MNTIQATRYGSPDVLQLVQTDTPMPKANEVLIKVQAVPVGFGDVLARNFKAVTPRSFSMPGPLWPISRLAIGLNKPNQPILGAEFAGVVEAVGEAVTRFQPGEVVIGYTGQRFGANAEFMCLPEKAVMTRKPAHMTPVEASTLPYGGMMALDLLKAMDIQPGQNVLINGASGSIGASAVQIAKRVYGAEVTGVCGTARLGYVRALGADHVIDYTREDFTQGEAVYDLIVDIRGKLPFERAQRVLAPEGRLLYVSFKMKHLMQMLGGALRQRPQRVICRLASESNAILDEVRDLAEAGKLTAIVDRCYPLVQTAEAHRYYESGDKQGAVVITVAETG